MSDQPTRRQYAQKLKEDGLRCNCDLDNWQPEPETGHSWVCRIHKAAMKLRIDGEYYMDEDETKSERRKQ